MRFQLQTIALSKTDVVLALSGEVDLSAAPELKGELLRLIDEGAKRLVFDLTSATFIDSTTLGVLIGAVKRLRPSGGEVLIVCRDPHLRKIFEITLLDRVFSIFDTREEAISALPKAF